LFDEDPRRKEIWTHTGAYLALPNVTLTAGADSDEDRRRRFLYRSVTANAYVDYRTMLQAENLQVEHLYADRAAS
jgi:predicted dehydrogenase